MRGETTGTRISVNTVESVRFMLKRAPQTLRLLYGLWMVLCLVAAVAGLALLLSGNTWGGAGLLIAGLLAALVMIRYAVGFITEFSLRDTKFRRHATEAGAIRGPGPIKSGGRYH